MKSDIRLFLSITGMLMNVTATLWIINVKFQPYVHVYTTRATHKHIKLDSGDITYSWTQEILSSQKLQLKSLETVHLIYCYDLDSYI